VLIYPTAVWHGKQGLSTGSRTINDLTGRMMKEEWLTAGEIHRQWHLAHLVSWVCVFISLALHLLMGAKVGGVPLLVSVDRKVFSDRLN
jgi:hypothetical protein